METVCDVSRESNSSDKGIHVSLPVMKFTFVVVILISKRFASRELRFPQLIQGEQSP